MLFQDWKRRLLLSAGTASPAVSGLGDLVLEVFFRQGCEPTLAALLDYAESGLHPRYETRPVPEPRSPLPSVLRTARPSQGKGGGSARITSG